MVGPCGLGQGNERGDRLYEWCGENEQVITSTWFRHYPRFFYMCKSPDDHFRKQTDYISINKRVRNSIQRVKTCPGAGYGSDHSRVVATMVLKLKKIRRAKIKVIRDLKSLRRNSTMKTGYEFDVKNRLDALPDTTDNDAEAQSSRIQEALNGAADEIIDNGERRMKQKWMTEEIIEKTKRRRLNNNKTPEYKVINEEIKEDCTRDTDLWLNEQCAEVEI